MNRLLLSVLLLLAAAPASAGTDRWTPYGPRGSWVADILFDPHSPGTQWIALGSVYKSEDGGASYHLSSSGIDNLSIQLLAIDPGQPDVLYAAPHDDPFHAIANVYRSRDGGAHWTPAADGKDFERIDSLAVAPGRAPGDPGVIFVCAGGVLFRSFDRGDSFQAAFSADQSIDVVAPDPRSPGIVYVTTLYQRFKSTDFGDTWTEIVEAPESFPFVHTLVVAPGDPQTLYETGDGSNVGATWRSRDGGATWQGPFPFRGTKLAVDPVDPNTVYGGGDIRGLSVSHDGGETFTKVTEGVPPLDIELTTAYGVYSIKTDPARPGHAFVCTPKGLFVTEDLGRTWKAAPLADFSNNSVYNFRIDPFDPAHWILTDSWTYYQSHDGGLTFTLLAGSLQYSGPMSIVEFDPFVRGQVWAVATGLAGRVGLFRSTDGGASWFRVGDAPWGYLLLPAPRVMLLSGQGLFRSGDNGHTWRDKLLPIEERLVQDPRNPRTLYDATGHYRSDDLGRTWRPWHNVSPAQVIAFDPFRPHTIHLVQDRTLLVTRDQGETFEVAGHFSFRNFPHQVVELLFDRERRDVLYATTADGVLRSQDGGATWEPLNLGLPPPYFYGPRSFLQDPVRGRRFYAMPGSGGLYRADFTGGVQ